MPDGSAKNPTATWRDRIKVHPAADLFPMMSEAELRALGNDIRQHELKRPITVYAPHIRPDALRHGTKAMKLAGDIHDKKLRGELELLDGRNRLDAMELVGVLDVEALLRRAEVHWLDDGPPEEFVISANIHRRHLTGEQKRDVIAALLKAQPGKSNRQIAKATRSSHPFVEKIRRDLQNRGDVETVSTRTDSKGRQQPARKPTMAVVVDSGPIEATDPLREVPRDQWRSLMVARQLKLQTQLSYACRLLVEFINDAPEMYQALGFGSVDAMVREGYGLSPAEIKIAAQWLQLHPPHEAISLDLAQQLAASPARI